MTCKIFRTTAPSLLAPVLLVLTLPALAQNEPRVDFETQVRPVLAAYCYECHGSNRAARESDLRLDKKQFAFADLRKSCEGRACICRHHSSLDSGGG